MTHKSLLSDFYGLSAADDEPEAPPPKDERRSLESEQFDAQVRAACAPQSHGQPDWAVQNAVQGNQG